MGISQVNQITLRRYNSVSVSPAVSPNYLQTTEEKAMLCALMKNIQSLGFTFSKELLGELVHFDRTLLEGFGVGLIAELKKKVGADVRYTPMYPNFPTQVALASDGELFFNAVIHYLTLGTILPEYEKKARFPIIDSLTLTEIKLCAPDFINEVFRNLLQSKTSLSEQDKEDVELLIRILPNSLDLTPDTIPLKENVALFGSILIKSVPSPAYAVPKIQKYFKTATDVLRLAVALSNGDISLAEDSDFKKFNRQTRKTLLLLLAGCSNIGEDMFRYRQKWLRLGEILHPGELHGSKFDGVKLSFNLLREGNKPLFFGGAIEGAISRGELETAAVCLEERPGEFARRLDKLLRDANETERDYIVGEFEKVAEKVSSTVLLQLIQHFVNRVEKVEKPRIYFPKGKVAKARLIEGGIPRIPDSTCDTVRRICANALIKKYAEKEPLGKVYVDPAMKNYLVPFSQRSASKAVKTIVRGSSLPIKDTATTVRGFIWWTNTDRTSSQDMWSYTGGRVDLDLSASVYDENWKHVDHVSYTRLRSGKFSSYHSGDITNGGSVDGRGVAEFIDFDIDAIAQGGRYVVFQIYNYTHQKFSDLPNARFGWMEREYPNSGEIFEPQTVAMKMDLTNDANICIPAIFDCKERKFIWCDLGGQCDGTCFNNLESNLKGVTAACYAITNIKKPNMGALAYLNAKARGELVETREEADTIFSPDETIPEGKENVRVITPFDTDVWMGEML